MQDLRIEIGRRVRIALAYGDDATGVVVAIHGELKGRKPAPGVMQIIHRDDATFDVLAFDGREFSGRREVDVGRLGIGCITLLDRVHGPAMIAQVHKLHAERVAREARERAEAPHRLAAAQAALVMPDQVPLFYWNGIKDAKGAPLQKAYYSSGYQRSPEGTIQITAKHYERFSDLVRACFAVRNDSDVMTDYFCQDSIEVTPAHPLYPQVKAAKEAQDAHQAKRAAR